VISTREPGRVVGARAGSPLVVGIGDGDHFLASDAAALLSVTRRVVYLDEGDIADVRLESYTIHDASGKPVERAIVNVEASGDSVELGPYRHFMQKEIFEQPRAVADTLESVGVVDANVFGANAKEILKKSRQRARAGLRHQPLFGAGREAMDRVARGHSVPGGNRQRIPLSR
jgi:glucosamine--fructose-6-phosphate aminotransferase (isomerizing)